MRRNPFTPNEKFRGYYIDYDFMTKKYDKNNPTDFKYKHYSAEGATKEEKQIVKGWSVQDESQLIVTSADLPFKVHGRIEIGGNASKILKVQVLRPAMYSHGGGRFKNSPKKRYVILIG